jgi:YD repeat-containing protein
VYGQSRTIVLNRSASQLSYLKSKMAERLVPANVWYCSGVDSRCSRNNWDNGSTLGELTRLTYPDSSIAERTYHDTGALNLLRLDGSTISTRTYDDEDRLMGFARTNGTFTQSWNLTKVGDWTSVTTNGTAQKRTHGPTHELLTAGGQSLATDPKGNITLLPLNLTPQSSPLSLQWDFDNKLRGADLGNNSSVDVNFQYDALGRRVARTGTGGSVVYVQHDQQTIADYPVGGVASTPTNRYAYASYIDEPVVRKAAGTGGTIHYYHRNQQYTE